MKCSLDISNFLEEISSFSHSVVFLYFFALIAEEGFRVSPCYSLELCIQMLISFLVRGGSREETPCGQGQGPLGEATSHPRPAAVTLKSHPEPEAKGGSWEEPPMPEARACSWEEHPEGLEELSHVEGQEQRW